MASLILYIIRFNLAIALLYVVYRLFLYHFANFVSRRIYLFGALVLSIFLPWVEFTQVRAQNQGFLNDGNLIQFPELLKEIHFLPTSDTIGSIKHFNYFGLAAWIYLFIGLIFFIGIISHLFWLRKIITENKRIKSGKVHYIINKKFSSPFSYFNFVFTKSPKEFENKPEYFHELAHVRQLHSIDRLLVEFLVPVLWINPFIYLFKKSIIEVHEHLADEAVIKSGIEPIEYQKYLYSQLKSGQYLKMTSNFNYSQTKKRITMISKNISNRKSIVFSMLSLLVVVLIFMMYGFNNHRIIAPVADNLKDEFLSDSDTIPSILPLKPGGNYWIGAKFGMRKHPVFGTMKMHNGIDIVADSGIDIISPADGTVIEAKWDNDYGNKILIKHGEGFVTLYAHLSNFNAKEGDKVKKGDKIGTVGSTGLATRAHLHYEVHKFPGDSSVNPIEYIGNIMELEKKGNGKFTEVIN